LIGRELQICFCLLILYSSSFVNAYAQQYFKLSENSDIYFNHQVTRFPNNDILIGDSSLEPLMTSRSDGKIVLARMDQCGNQLWSYSYSLGFGYLEFRDFTIRDNGGVVAYGSYFDGTEEFLFLLSVNGETGKNAVFQIYDPKTINGYFGYSLELIEDQFLVYGFLVNPNIGFMAMIDNSLQAIWAMKISPFQANGAALVISDESIMARSGKYLFKMSSKGDLKWATVSSVSVVNGPIKTNTGILFEAHKEGLSFLFMIDHEGQLLWKTTTYKAVEASSAISTLDNETILLTYNCPDGNENNLCQLFFSPNGQIIEQKKLSIEQRLNTGILTQSISDNEIITIAANTNAFVSDNTDSKDFIMQYSLSDLDRKCVSWDDFVNPDNEQIDLEFQDLELDVVDFDLQMTERIQAAVDTFLFPLSELCEENFGPELINRDTLIGCNESWTVSLPNPGFFWEDGTIQNPRILVEEGLYKAKNDNCRDLIQAEFVLSKKDCGCHWYLPNVFRPHSAHNNIVGLFTDCDIQDYQMFVFNSSGRLIFESNDLEVHWDGQYDSQDAQDGVYIVAIQFSWIDQFGQTIEEAIFQDVTLLY